MSSLPYRALSSSALDSHGGVARFLVLDRAFLGGLGDLRGAHGEDHGIASRSFALAARVGALVISHEVRRACDERARQRGP